MDENDVSVRVAVRIRPQIPKEIINMSAICTHVTPNEPQIVLGSDKAFTYDFVFDTGSVQEDLYDECVSNLVRNALDGYNATVLAYGQTGSGKTYTMGTGFDVNIPIEQIGIVPRAISHLFDGIEERIYQSRNLGEVAPQFKVTAQFLELYNEEVIDLFNPIAGRHIRGCGFKIHEDPSGDIHVKGVTVKTINTVEDAMNLLRQGALSRSTASTEMNTQSSRSHAIFTLHIVQQRLCKKEEADYDDNAAEETPNDFETLSAKFHFVDLAGSERLKRTGATGDRAREGISINCGLLALGNVISALGDKAKKALHVPYRDSKLTRLLQDSLGGNSQTVMIACISPSDRDFMETLNTLKYANRARNIQNHITINQDKSSRTINVLKQQIAQLQAELIEFKQGKRMIEADGTETINDMFYENSMLKTELNNLKTRVKAMQETIDSLTAKNTLLLAEKQTSAWLTSDQNVEITDMVHTYLQEIEDLRAKLLEANYMCEQLRKTIAKGEESLSNSFMMSSTTSADFLDDTSSIIEEAKKSLELERSKLERSRKTDDADELNYDSSDKDSDSEIEESDSERTGLQAELVNLSSNIDYKQRLIDELEQSQQRMLKMRRDYEDKLSLLETRIRDTQEERDKILESFTAGHNSEPKEKVMRVRQDYERKIQDMQREVKKLQKLQKEHVRLLKSKTTHQTQIELLKNEVTEMKRTKVKLMNQMKDESKKHKEEEIKRKREIAQLKKESRRNASIMENLQSKDRRRDLVLRRKTEEVTALRRERNRRLQGSNRKTELSSSKSRTKVAKQLWVTVEKLISKLSMSKKNLVEQEIKMEHLLEKRTHLGEELEQYQLDRATLVGAKLSTDDIDNLIDDCKASINYVQDSISDAQHSCMEIDEFQTQVTNEAVEIAHSISDIKEAHYIIQQLFNVSINQSYTAAQRDAKLKENEATVKELSQEVEVRSLLLDHMLHAEEDNATKQVVVPIVSANANESDPEPSSAISSRSSSPTDTDTPQSSRTKIRGRTAKPQELLFGSAKSEEIVVLQSRDSATTVVNQAVPTTVVHHTVPSHSDPGMRVVERKPVRITSPKQSPRLQQQQRLMELSIINPNNSNNTDSPNNKITERRQGVLPSPKATHRVLFQQSKHGSIEHVNFGESSSPPSSPQTYRRNLSRDDNVFDRLTSSTIQPEEQATVGTIIPMNSRNSSKYLLQCMYVAEGHSSGVLSVCATDDLLFTGAADRTVKIWDLHKGIEKSTLTGHPNNVVAVRYFAPSQLLLSASSAFVKMWDLRTSDSQCIRVLCSSGMTQSGNSLSLLSANRSAQIPVGESQINDTLFNTAGTMICTASSGKVKLWDVRKLAPVAKLGGHQAAIMCLACEPTNTSTDLLITGSKDHYIKVFNIGHSENGNIAPSVNLEPPHYDGVQSLAVEQNILFSGSRDMCIKKWNLSKSKLVQSISNAHRSWICGLALLKEQKLLLSGCRMGYIKIWETTSCNQISEIKGHPSSINAITVNKKFVFTASNCGQVKMWKYGQY